MTSPTFTLDELLEFLRQEPEAPKGYMTTRQWAMYFGISSKRMRGIMREAYELGILLRRETKQERYDGVRMPTQVYAFMLEMNSDD